MVTQNIIDQGRDVVNTWFEIVEENINMNFDEEFFYLQCKKNSNLKFKYLDNPNPEFAELLIECINTEQMSELIVNVREQLHLKMFARLHNNENAEDTIRTCVFQHLSKKYDVQSFLASKQCEVENRIVGGCTATTKKEKKQKARWIVILSHIRNIMAALFNHDSKQLGRHFQICNTTCLQLCTHNNHFHRCASYTI